LERSNKELEQFAFVASHDLQEPLRKVMVFSEHLKSLAQHSLEPEALDDLERLQRSTQRMQCLIDDLLNLSRVTRHGQPFQAVDLSHVLRDVLADLSYKIKELDARIEAVADLPVLEADSRQMHQMLFQLVDNALKFHRKGITPVVKVDAEVLDGQLVLTVSDNGVGIKKEYLDKIFDTFVRLHHGKELDGTGIGLSLVHKIVERHNGTVAVESTMDEGTRLRITLPLRQR
jgi:light-regulated signal transduction histidine kinase (bacteriophytochrome)